MQSAGIVCATIRLLKLLCNEDALSEQRYMVYGLPHVRGHEARSPDLSSLSLNLPGWDCGRSSASSSVTQLAWGSSSSSLYGLSWNSTGKMMFNVSWFYLY